jgi:hypothetical protein
MGAVFGTSREGPLTIREVGGMAGNLEGGSAVEFRLEVDGVEQVIWFRCARRQLRLTGEAVVAALFLPVLVRGERVDCPLAVDPEFASGLSRLEGVFARWGGVGKVGRIQSAVEEPDRRPRAGRTAAFFTGGVDSFDTLLFEGGRLDALVYVHGFDVKLSDVGLRERVSKSLAQVAQAAGKELVEVETNLREFLDGLGLSWKWAHGSGLVAVAHLLTGEFGRILISSTQSLEAPDPWGSHPETDPLWSSGRMQIEHVGAERTREQKVEAIAVMELARRHLRVCYENRNGAYNCGRCEKCVRTMVALEVMGVLDSFRTMPGPLRKRRLVRLELPDEDSLWLLDQNRNFARRKGTGWGLRAALWICRRQWLSRGWILWARRWCSRWLSGWN